MKKLLLLAFLAITVSSTAQNTTLPQFPGGKSELKKYLDEQVSLSTKKDSLAYASVLFYVGKDGSILRPTIATSYPENAIEYENIALEIIKQMPQWTPGTIDNIPEEMAACVYINFGAKEKISPYPTDDVELSIKDVEFLDEEGTEEDQKIQISIADIPENDENEDGVDIVELREHKVVVEEKEKAFVTVEQMPTFAGGETELRKFIAENLKYPVVAQENGVQGHVTLRFIVEKDGTLSDIRVQRGIDPLCDKEAVRLMKISPKWIPGKQNGQTVRVYHTLSVTFKTK